MAPSKSRAAGDLRSGRFAYEGLDRVIHEKARLGIMTSLLTRREGLSFADLKDVCALSDGNLSRHLAVLQEAGCIEIEKEGGGRGSKTLCRVTSAGRDVFLRYLGELERVIADAASAGAAGLPAHRKVRPGLSAT
jgi:predicted transcriptional regulator